ncbi:PucR family transcriptional regulator [Nonomuraea sediminis]|uniref:PucR family transcriptional regulator n=1 Tax=Nonomuraea sediminis TaxID=2835864 RepID=UPI001BDBD541|nr:helix-turn-helix domain-containing protein [Nonomuraea sediminis]
MRAAGWEAPVTVAELVNAGPLAGARMYGAGEGPVHQVRIVDELSVFASVAPHTAVVLIGAAASGGWAVEMAMRRAWEQAAACVIAPASGLSEGSGEVLAERLGVTLIFVEEDPLITAVRVASAASRPEGARTQLVARCATRLAGAGSSARHVLGVLNAELPGVSVAFLDPYGRLLAGRQAAGEGRVLASVEVPDLDGGVLGRLVASGAARSSGWPSVVSAVLGLAVAPLTAWAAVERLSASRDFARQEAVAQRLLASFSPVEGEAGSRTGAPVSAGASVRAVVDEDVVVEAVALGWPVEGPVTGFVVRPVDGSDVVQARAVLAATVGEVPVVRRREGVAGWSALGADELAVRLERCVATLPWSASAGVGTTAGGLAGLGESLLGAEAGALVAGSGSVARADRMGPAELLAALPAGVLRAPATVVLRPLLAVDKDGTLLETLVAYFDEGGALKAAERLGVHRNTVATRLERIRAVGYDLDDPATRLALHLAGRVLRASGSSPRRR